MDIQSCCLFFIGKVLIAKSALATEFPDGAVCVVGSLHLGPASQQTDTEILRRISSHFSFDGIDRSATFLDPAETSFYDRAWVINPQEYPSFVFQTLHSVSYLGETPESCAN